MVQHCVTALDRQGGVQTYISSLLRNQPGTAGNQAINLLEGIDQAQFDLLHLHDPKQLRALTGVCPAVFTLHNHSTYCPSGTKYLSAQHRSCERTMSSWGCTWGRLVDGCGSRRPERILRDLQSSLEDLEILRSHPIPTIAISHYARRQLIQQGLSPKQVTTIHHGIEPLTTGSSPLTSEIHQGRRLLFVGRIVPQKGLDLLLRALAQTPPILQLDVAGEGWFQPQLKELAQQLGLEQRITWHGWCSRETLNQLYEQCFAVVFPSVWPEPAGLITLETYARQRPVIATEVGGIPEYILPDQTGVLVPPNQPATLAEAITQLASDYSRAADLAARGHDYFRERFTIEHHIKALSQFYDQVTQTFSMHKQFSLKER